MTDSVGMDDAMQATSPNGDVERETIIADTVDREALAWSHDAELNDDGYRPLSTAFRVFVAVLAFGGVLAMVWLFMVNRHPMLREIRTPPVTSVVVKPAPPVTVTAAPPATVTSCPECVPPVFTGQDWQFLDSLQQDGISSPTADAAAYAVVHAHNVCDYLATHATDGILSYVQRTTIWTDQNSALGFISGSKVFYCPQYD